MKPGEWSHCLAHLGPNMDVPMRHRSTEEPLEKIGDFQIREVQDGRAYIHWFCPHNGECSVRLTRGPAQPGQPNTWGWDGDADNPTLTPSINCLANGCGWHGHIQGGVQRQIPDGWQGA